MTRYRCTSPRRSFIASWSSELAACRCTLAAIGGPLPLEDDMGGSLARWAGDRARVLSGTADRLPEIDEALEAT